KDGFLSMDFGLREFGVAEATERVRLYRRFLYEAGGIKKGEVGRVTGERGIKQEVIERERKKGYRVTRVDRFRFRTRYFTDSGIIGSREFVRLQYERVKELFGYENEKKPKPVAGLAGMYSLKRLSEG
ncbi:MAG: hypothetical protein ACOZF0_07375, partial [Thermodesulfobacteriota bacterium]